MDDEEFEFGIELCHQTVQIALARDFGMHLEPGIFGDRELDDVLRWGSLVGGGHSE
jgi:hypothetical protein